MGVVDVDLHARSRHRGIGGRWMATACAGLFLVSGGQALAQPAQVPTAQIPAGQIPAGKPGAQIADPWEGANRKFYELSMAVDHAVIAPVVHGYLRVTPGPVKTGVKNVVNNLFEPRVFANDVLQGRFHKAGQATIRFAVNSTVGLGGLIDVASKTGVPYHDSDFGQTLGRWGVGPGPYIFVPFYGPSDLRDGIGRLADAFGDPVSWTIGDLTTTFGQVRTGVDVLQARVDIDDELQGLNRDFTDPYVTLRSGFSQNRAYKVDEAKGVSPAAQVKDLPDFGAETPPAPAKP